MTAMEHIEAFLRERDRISHDLVQNVFFAALQPCGSGSGRFGDADLIYAALRGTAEAGAPAREVMDAWRSQIAPAILALVDAASQRHGLVASDRWQRDARDLRAACAVLSNFSFGSPQPVDAALARATEFWAASDSMCRILSAMKTDFSAYFLRWDRALINV